jgi:hypothetical protein
MAFSCIRLSSLREVAVVCSSYAVKCMRCCMTVLALLCYRLNKYYAYLAITAIPVLKWGPSRSNMASRRCFHTRFSRLQIGKSVIGIEAVAARRLSYREVSATCAVYKMVVSGSLPMTVPIHATIGSKDIVTLTSHTSRPRALDRQQW